MWMEIAQLSEDKKHLKNVGPIRHCEPPHAHSPGVARGTAARGMRIDVQDNWTTTTTTTTTTRDRGDRYIMGPMKMNWRCCAVDFIERVIGKFTAGQADVVISRVSCNRRRSRDAQGACCHDNRIWRPRVSRGTRAIRSRACQSVHLTSSHTAVSSFQDIEKVCCFRC